MKDQISMAGRQMKEALTLESNCTVSVPLEKEVSNFTLLLEMLNNSVTTVMAFLAILCCQLIYSLMLSDVEEKTYEFGMLRALGFNRKNIVHVIILQACIFSIAGIAFGLIAAEAFNALGRYFLFKLAENSGSYRLSSTAIWYGVSLGIVLPILSNVIPIKRALGKNLRASLDLYHRSVNEISISMKAAKDIGLSVNQLILSLLMVVLGIATYYVAPAAFLYNNMPLFFMIMNALLLLMILGMTFVAILLLPMVQRGIVKAFLTCCCRKDRKLMQIVMKNLVSHKSRNSKTAIMFAICLSFLIFSGSSFALMGKLLQSQVDSALGADLYAFNTALKTESAMLEDVKIGAFLDD
mmetsp:Transcript_29437/g.44573  ORF Transcript_29437/g.44573 Transcript_29437/m.44573 type:complete len:353 (+) Transcript_29437:1900-2958(+)